MSVETITPRPVEGTLDADFLCVHGWHLGIACPSCAPAVRKAVASIERPAAVSS